MGVSSSSYKRSHALKLPLNVIDEGYDETTCEIEGEKDHTLTSELQFKNSLTKKTCTVIDLRSQGLDNDDLQWILPRLTSRLNNIHQQNQGKANGDCVISRTISLLLDSNNLSSTAIENTIIPFAMRHRIACLSLYANKVGMYGMTALVRFLNTNHARDLRSLDLDATNMQECSLTALARALTRPSCSSVRELRLASNCFGDMSLLSLADLIECEQSKLQKLYLSDNHIESYEIVPLAHALMLPPCTLTFLDLAGNRVDDIGARSLAETLCINSTLQHLDISRCKIRLEGAISLASALVQNVTLIWLDVCANPLTHSGVMRLSRTLNVNNTLLHFQLPLAELSSDFNATREFIRSNLERNHRLFQKRTSSSNHLQNEYSSLHNLTSMMMP